MAYNYDEFIDLTYNDLVKLTDMAFTDYNLILKSVIKIVSEEV